MQSDTFPYHYRAYGLLFASVVPLPFEPVAAGKPDVTVRFGEVPEKLEGASSGRGFWSAQPGAYLMDNAATGRAIVRDGHDVIIGDDSPDIVRVFLTGSVLTTLLQQRGFVTLHASAVAIDGKVVAIVGKSEAGKSTTAATLASSGHAFLGDDVLALRCEEDGSITAVPSFPSVALWRDACERLDMSCDTKRPRMQGVEKYLVEMDGFRSDPLPLAHIVYLERQLVEECVATPLSSQELFQLTLQNIHRKRAAMAQGCWPTIFDALGKIAKGLPGTSISRPDRGNSTDEVARMIEQLVGATQAEQAG